MWGLSYWVFPVISAFCWLGTLMGLLIHWTSTGRPHYVSMEPNQTIAYISDVGADNLKPLFIAGSCVTTIFLDLSFLSEQWLRSRGRLAANTSVTQKVLAFLSILSAIAGTVGLICLSIWDTRRHNRLHNTFLVCFLGGYILSAIFICAEYQRLGIHFRQHRVLRISFWIKLFFILLEIALAVAFGVCGHIRQRNNAAILEWTIAFIFTLYILSFFIDLIPAIHTKQQGNFEAGETELEREANDADSLNGKRSGRGLFGRRTAESERTLGRNDVPAVAENGNGNGGRIGGRFRNMHF